MSVHLCPLHFNAELFSLNPQNFAVFRDVQVGRGLARAGLPSVGDVLPAVHRVRRAGPQRHLQLDQRLLQSRVRERDLRKKFQARIFQLLLAPRCMDLSFIDPLP